MSVVKKILRLIVTFHGLFFAISTLSVFVSFIIGVISGEELTEEASVGVKKCSELLMGQYLCLEPDIDSKTQQARNCNKERQEVTEDNVNVVSMTPGHLSFLFLLLVWCKTAPGIAECDGLFPNGSFQRTVPCKWTNGHSFETALLLSVFLGMFGVDRFYLGYPAIGLLKFATLGFMFLGQLIDILLIATQVLTPSDGSAYVVDYYGASSVRTVTDNDTFLLTGV